MFRRRQMMRDENSETTNWLAPLLSILYLVLEGEALCSVISNVGTDVINILVSELVSIWKSDGKEADIFFTFLN